MSQYCTYSEDVASWVPLDYSPVCSRSYTFISGHVYNIYFEHAYSHTFRSCCLTGRVSAIDVQIHDDMKFLFCNVVGPCSEGEQGA